MEHCKKTFRQRLVKRTLIYVPLVAVVVTLCAVYAEPVMRQVGISSSVGQCMTLQTDPAKVVYRYQPSDIMLVSDASHGDPQSLGKDDDGCQLIPHHILPPGATPDATPVDTFNQYLTFLIPDYSQTIFCHGLTTASGESRLVLVSLAPQDRPVLYPQLHMEALVFSPGSLITPPKLLAHDYFLFPDPLAAQSATDFHMGQQDPKNPGTFTVSYLTDGMPQTARFSLTADGIHLQPKNQ